jgi:hypothetical protein
LAGGTAERFCGSGGGTVAGSTDPFSLIGGSLPRAFSERSRRDLVFSFAHVGILTGKILHALSSL